MRAAARIITIGGIAAAGTAAAILALRPAGPDIQTIDLHPSARTSSGPAMCPWREPQKDMRAFFPGATGFTEEIAGYSRKKAAIQRRLGPNYRMETTALTVYHVHRGASRAGDVVVRRTSGPHGAIEVVVGLGSDRRIVGVRVQRQREPQATTRAITSVSWLGSFVGSGPDSEFQVGRDLPAVPSESRDAAEAVARAVHNCLVEMDEVDEAVTAAPHANHER